MILVSKKYKVGLYVDIRVGSLRIGRHR